MLTITVATTFLIFIAIGLVWLFGRYGIDKLLHPKEWKTAGSAGERMLFWALIEKFHIPENQIFRNVYIPRDSNRTAEIDLLVVSKKGIFVFECKNYGGNIYGDARRKRWIQYLGRKKSYFYNPLFQNKNHAKYLKDFLSRDKINVPIIPVVSTAIRGPWKVRNLGTNDYILGLNCHFEDIYESLPISGEIVNNFKTIISRLSPLSRPGEEIKKKHIETVSNFSKT